MFFFKKNVSSVCELPASQQLSDFLTQEYRLLPGFYADSLYLRPFQLSDARDIHRICSQSALTDWLPSLPVPYRLKDARDWIRQQSQSFLQGDLPFVVELREDKTKKGVIVGAVSLTFLKKKPIAELGFWSNPNYWGQGYITEAARLLMAYGFTFTEIEEIHALALSENLPSIRVQEKLGMQFLDSCYISLRDNSQTLGERRAISKERFFKETPPSTIDFTMDLPFLEYYYFIPVRPDGKAGLPTPTTKIDDSDPHRDLSQENSELPLPYLLQGHPDANSAPALYVKNQVEGELALALSTRALRLLSEFYEATNNRNHKVYAQRISEQDSAKLSPPEWKWLSLDELSYLPQLKAALNSTKLFPKY